ARRTACADLPRCGRGEGIAREAGGDLSADTTATGVVAPGVQREDLLVEGHEERARRRKDVRLTKAVAVRVVRGLRQEHAHRWALAQLWEVSAQLGLRRYGRGRAGGTGHEHDQRRR